MCKGTVSIGDPAGPATPLPWFVNVWPDYYDDDDDTGFNWEGWAVDESDAVRQALETCHVINEREPEDRAGDIDPARAKVCVAEIDFRRLERNPISLHHSRRR